MKRFLYIFTEVSTHGGIENYAKNFLKTSLSIMEDSTNTVLLLNNKTLPSTLIGQSSNNTFICCGSKLRLYSKIKFVLAFLHQIISSRPQHIISNHINLSPLCMLASSLMRIKYSIITYGIEAWDIKSNLIRRALSNAAKIISISQYTKDRIKNQISNLNNKIVIIHPVLEFDRFFPKEKSQELLRKHNLNNNKVILTVSRLSKSEKHKGYDNIIKSLPMIRKDIPNVRYLLVGSGNDTLRIKTIIDETCCGDIVTLCGYVNDKELVDYYNLCDVFVMPSKKEGFGIVFLEALACGKPVIAGNKDGSRDALINGELGILVDPDNINDISNAIIKVLKKETPEKLLDIQYLSKRVNEVYGYSKFKESLRTFLRSL